MYWAFGIFSALIIGYVIYLNLSIKYIINKTDLIIKCGVLYNKEISIYKIKSVARTSILLSSPAPSFDRIEIIYNTFESLVLSPKHEVEFAKALTEINPEIINKVNNK